jgi:hypothetical protein
MVSKNFENGLKRNKISDKNIKLCLQLKEFAEKIGFEMSEYDYVDDYILVEFEIKEDK